jgi:hypothetical protein
MRSTASKQSNWQSTTIFLAVLLGAIALIVPLASGCSTNDVTAYHCEDAGAPDGGDAGDGGAGGSGGRFCK